MSDQMMLAVLQMPYDMAMSDELSRRQFYNRVQELVARFEALHVRDMASHGNAEDQFIAQHAHLNCPACGGSGHVDDVISTTPKPIRMNLPVSVSSEEIEADKALKPRAQPEQEPVTSAAKDAIMGAAYDFRDAHFSGSQNLKRSAHAALESAVDAALSQPEQEPVEFDVRCYSCGGDGYDPKNNNYYCSVCNSSGFVEKLLYTTPLQRKPLTDEMRKQMKESCDSMEMRGAFADGWISAETAHGIKE